MILRTYRVGVVLLSLLVVVVLLGKNDSWDDGEKFHDVRLSSVMLSLISSDIVI